MLATKTPFQVRGSWNCTDYNQHSLAAHVIPQFSRNESLGQAVGSSALYSIDPGSISRLGDWLTFLVVFLSSSRQIPA